MYIWLLHVTKNIYNRCIWKYKQIIFPFSYICNVKINSLKWNQLKFQERAIYPCVFACINLQLLIKITENIRSYGYKLLQTFYVTLSALRG